MVVLKFCKVVFEKKMGWAQILDKYPFLFVASLYFIPESTHDVFLYFTNLYLNV